jgi:hypothetical protein
VPLLSVWYCLKTHQKRVGEVIIDKESAIFWDVRPSTAVEVPGRFGGTYYSYLYGRRVIQESDPEDGNTMYLRNVIIPDYTTSHPRR